MLQTLGKLTKVQHSSNTFVSSYTRMHRHRHTHDMKSPGVRNKELNETSILSRVKQITSPGWMHETTAQGWCTGKTQRDGMGSEVGGGIGMGNTCKSMADSCQCMAKTTTIL